MQQQSDILHKSLRKEIDRVALLCILRAGWGVIAREQLGFVSAVHNSSASLFEVRENKLVYLQLLDFVPLWRL